MTNRRSARRRSVDVADGTEQAREQRNGGDEQSARTGGVREECDTAAVQGAVGMHDWSVECMGLHNDVECVGLRRRSFAVQVLPSQRRYVQNFPFFSSLSTPSHFLPQVVQVHFQVERRTTRPALQR